MSQTSTVKRIEQRLRKLLTDLEAESLIGRVAGMQCEAGDLIRECAKELAAKTPRTVQEVLSEAQRGKLQYVLREIKRESKRPVRRVKIEP